MNARKTVLIVEDEPDILKMTEFRLRKAGYGTIKAEDGVNALKKAREDRPDLILLDYRLPDMNGIEVYRELRNDGGLKDIPVVFLTASSRNEDLVEKMREVGAKHSIIKPYEPEDLLGKISELIG